MRKITVQRKGMLPPKKVKSNVRHRSCARTYVDSSANSSSRGTAWSERGEFLRYFMVVSSMRRRRR